MGYKRSYAPIEFLTGATASAASVAIRMLFAAEPSSQEPNMKDTLLAASLKGTAGDFHISAMLTDWLDVHAGRVVFNRLVRLAVGQGSPHVLTYWSAIAKQQKTDSRFEKLQDIFTCSQADLLTARLSSPSHVKVKTSASLKHCSGLPNSALRRRPTDTSIPSEVA